MPQYSLAPTDCIKSIISLGRGMAESIAKHGCFGVGTEFYVPNSKLVRYLQRTLAFNGGNTNIRDGTTTNFCILRTASQHRQFRSALTTDQSQPSEF